MKKLLTVTAAAMLLAGTTGCTSCGLGSCNPFTHPRQVARPIYCPPQQAPCVPCAPAYQPCAQPCPPPCNTCDPCAGGGAQIIRSSNYGGEIVPASGEVSFAPSIN